jgi:hypothetical protein
MAAPITGDPVATRPSFLDVQMQDLARTHLLSTHN